LQLQAAGTTVATIQSTGLNLGSNGVVFSDSSSQTAAASPNVLKNRIINGAMVIDQRNAGASITPSGDPVYTLDRWYITQSQNSKFTIQQNAGSVTPPSGYKNYLGATVVSAVTVGASDYFSLAQPIEGFNIADLNWGTANAQTVTLSFWVRSSLTGTFGGALRNATGNLSYPFTYTISSANTWEQKSVTIAGSTSGTWNSTNTEGVIVRFGLGAGSTFSGTSGAWATQNSMSATGATSVVGTNGATFYITGVQLEQNTTATPFERRLYGQELANCQRYYYKVLPNADFGLLASGGYSSAANSLFLNAVFPVTMRVGPSSLETTGTAANYRVSIPGANVTLNAVPSLDVGTPQGCTLNATTASGVSTNLPAMLRTSGTSGYLAWSAEL
jgi:hypothetical protein